MPADTLEQAVKSAVETHGDPAGESTTVNPPNPPNSPVPDTKVDDPDEDTEETEDDDSLEDDVNPEDDELSEEEQIKARQLFKALKDPAQQTQIIDFLATKAGYQKVENKTEATEAKKDIKAILKENLGEEFDFLTEKLGPAIDKIINERLADSTKDIREKQAKSEELRFRNEADAAINNIGKVYYGGKEIPADISDQMSKLMDKIQPGVDMTTREYLENIYFIAVGRTGKTANQKAPIDTNGRAASNRNNAPSRLSNTTKAAPVDNNANGKMSLNESIAKAIEAANAASQ